MAVRLAQDIGMPLIAAYARRFGIYDNLSPYIAMALGSGETTLMRLTTAYAMLANGGKRLKPSLVDRIQDRSGRIIYRHDERLCPGCGATTWRMQAEPVLVDHREQVLDPRTAYQITSMLESVVQDGTARVLQGLGPDIAGKTGTTNEARDVWFVGYSPQLVAGVYVGYDDARPLGHEATGGRIAAPIFGDFMKSALADQPPAPFAIPTGIKLIPIDANSGQRASSYGPPTLLEAFKVGTAPSGITEPTNEI